MLSHIRARLVGGLAAALFGLATTHAAAQDASRWFLAEGASNAVLEQEILVGNPGTADLAVTITLLPDPGAVITPGAVLTRAFPLRATSRLTVRVAEAFPGLNGAASAEVSAVVAGTSTPADIVVERSMYFPDGSRLGGHNASGVRRAEPRWILAEGASGPFSTFILVANPNAAPSTVRVQYLKSTGEIIEFTQSLPAMSRTTFWPQVDYPAQLGVAEFSTVVESLDPSLPIVAERAMYFDPGPSGSGFARSGHDALGVPDASVTWYFAEGFVGGNAQTAFETFLLLANTNPTETTATVDYQIDGTAVVSVDYRLAPNQRFTVWVDQEARRIPALAGASFGMSVKATQPIVAERAMYWGTPSATDPSTPTLPWREGHATAGSPVTAPRWAFAEGREGADVGGRPYSTFFLLANPNETPITVRATFMTEDGGGLTTTVAVPARGRANIWPTAGLPEFAALANRRFATFLESIGDEPYVAERAMYVFADFASGHVNLGTPWPGPIGSPSRLPTSASVTGFTQQMRLSGNETLTITGSGFTADTEVSVAGLAARVTSVTPTAITAVAPSLRGRPGFGAAGSSPLRITSAGETRLVGNVQRVFRVMAIGDSFTEGLLVELLPPGTSPPYYAELASPPYPQGLRAWLRGDARLGPGVVVSNEGRSGECAAVAGCSSNPTSGRGRIGTLVTQSAWDAVIIMEGFNDQNDGRQSAGSIIAALRDMGRAAAAAGAIPVMGILEGPMDGLASGIAGMATQEGFARHTFRGIELGNDNVHPSQEGYDEMARQAYDKLRALFP